MPIPARRLIRKMRGGAQAHLIEAADGHCYVVKFQNNPQHRRILVNELVASVFLRYLQISSPECGIIEISEDFLEANPEVSIQLGPRSIRPKPGWHYGSRYPGHPDTSAVYDFVPDALLNAIGNPLDFLATLVFDKWMANADGRQCVFFRARLREWTSTAAHPLKLGFVALMIDHGFVFNGPYWDFPESPVQGLYPRKSVYHRVRSLDDFQPWLDRVIYFPEAVVDQALRQVPAEWIEDEEECLERLFDNLLRRRKRVPDLILACRNAVVSPFPNWA